MKKVVFVLLISIVFSGCKKRNEINIPILNINGTNVIIPLPENGFIEVGKFANGYCLIKKHESNILKCIFMDSIKYRKIKEGFNNITFDDKLFIITLHNIINTNDINENDFKSFKKNEIKFVNQDIKQRIEKINSDSTIIRNKKMDVKIKETDSVDVIYETTNTMGLLISVYIKENSNDTKSLYTRNYIRIKNKLILVTIMCKNEGLPSILWISKTSESYIKAILEANK